MKTLKFIKLSILLIVFMVVLNSCEKDEISTTGKLSHSFFNHPSDITIVISPVENTQIIIYTMTLDNNGKAEKELNIGNYYLQVSSDTYFSPIGFQIKSDQTTSISWGSNNGSKIE